VISVIIPAYNAETTLARTLDSLLAQTDAHWEAVVVNDGSTDDTLEIAIDYAQRDQRIKVAHQDNGGTAGALNAGVQRSAGDFFVHLDADDELLPHFIERTTQMMERHPGYDIYASNAIYRSPDGEETLFNQGERFAKITSLALADEIDHSQIFVTAPLRRTFFDAVGGFRTHIYNEDYDLWLRAMASGARHIFMPEALTVVHLHEGQKTADALKMRSSDVEILSDLVASGLLRPADRRLARSVIARHKKNLKRRRLMYTVLGKKRTERLIASKREGGARS